MGRDGFKTQDIMQNIGATNLINQPCNFLFKVIYLLRMFPKNAYS